MSAEKIIKRIKKDAEKEVKNILKEAEKQAAKIQDDTKKQVKTEVEKILRDGKKQCENIKKILISKANQDVKREIIKAQEKIIEECFNKAYQKLFSLPEKKYADMVTRLIKKSCAELGRQCLITISRDIDRKIAEKLGIKVEGQVKASGGVILKSADGKITIDNTFDSILKRRKDELRTQVGKILFHTKK